MIIINKLSKKSSIELVYYRAWLPPRSFPDWIIVRNRSVYAIRTPELVLLFFFFFIFNRDWGAGADFSAPGKYESNSEQKRKCYGGFNSIIRVGKLLTPHPIRINRTNTHYDLNGISYAFKFLNFENPGSLKRKTPAHYLFIYRVGKNTLYISSNFAF